MTGDLPGEVPREGAEDHHPEPPDIRALLNDISLPLNSLTDLGRSIRDPGGNLPHHRPLPLSHPEVHEFDTGEILVVHENVLWFDVAVHEVFAVHELYGRGNLGHHVLYLQKYIIIVKLERVKS